MMPIQHAVRVRYLFWALLVFSILADISQAQPTDPQNPELAAELLKLGEEDQKYRQQLQNMLGAKHEPGSPAAKEIEALTVKQAEIDSRNIARLEAIISQHRWPGKQLVGVKSARAAFLIVQHADLAVQEKYLPLLQAAGSVGDAQPSEVALLEDRVNMRQGKPQVYGSQLYSSPETDGKLQLYPIDDEPYVDARRAKAGLQPLAEYLKLFELTYTPCNDLFQPIWQGDKVFGESSLLFQDSEDGDYLARLAFPVEKLLAVRTADRQRVIDVRQIEVGEDGFELRLPRSLKLTAVLRESIYLKPDSPNSYSHRRDRPEQWLLYGPGAHFHQRQIEVTYLRKEFEWTAAKPTLQRVLLPATIEKLTKGESLKIGISGDSISTGLDASGSCNTPPFQPGYPELVVQKLQRAGGGEIKLVNRAVAGWSVSNGLADLDNLLESQPDLIIIAYGMNDVGRRDPAWFGQTIDQMLQAIHRKLPTAEVILVSPMLGNAEWVHTPREMFEPYRDQLKTRVGPGVALADLTAMWDELLKRKHDLDLTGNGLNHPNDFGHRLYAQAILGLLVP